MAVPMNDGNFSCPFFSKTQTRLWTLLVCFSTSVDESLVYGWRPPTHSRSHQQNHSVVCSLRKQLGTSFTCGLSGYSWEEDIPTEPVYDRPPPPPAGEKKTRPCSLCICRTSSSRSFLTPVSLSLLHHLGLPRVGFSLERWQREKCDVTDSVRGRRRAVRLQSTSPNTHHLFFLVFPAFFTFAACADSGKKPKLPVNGDIWMRA